MKCIIFRAVTISYKTMMKLSSRALSDKYVGKAWIGLPEINQVHYLDSNSNDQYFDNIAATACGMRYPLGVNRIPKWPVWMTNGPTEDRYSFVCDLSHLRGVDIVLNKANLQLVIQDRFHKDTPNEECLKGDDDQFQLNLDGYNICEAIPMFRKTIQLPDDCVTGTVSAGVSKEGLLTISVARAKDQKSIDKYSREGEECGMSIHIPINEDKPSQCGEELGVRE